MVEIAKRVQVEIIPLVHQKVFEKAQTLGIDHSLDIKSRHHY